MVPGTLGRKGSSFPDPSVWNQRSRSSDWWRWLFPNTSPEVFPKLCQVLCISYPPHSQNSNLRPREKAAQRDRGWLGPEYRPTHRGQACDKASVTSDVGVAGRSSIAVEWVERVSRLSVAQGWLSEWQDGCYMTGDVISSGPQRAACLGDILPSPSCPFPPLRTHRGVPRSL